MQESIDSLHTVLVDHEKIATLLQNIEIILDSIDSERNIISTYIEERAPYENLLERLIDINEYVIKAEEKIQKLEKQVQKTNMYYSIIVRLKKELQEKNDKIIDLQFQIQKIEDEKNVLYTVVETQKQELKNKDEDIEIKKKILSLLEMKIDSIMRQIKVSESDAYFLQAQTLEEVAKKTKFAPRKKRKTLARALEFYEKSFNSGKMEAKEKIETLKKKLQK
ncbi:MAG: hypothetical protein QM536_04905 [Chitinophagaceae bacterium]|nr:hypothetical protein [Chitinophagaceae bacterium]